MRINTNTAAMNTYSNLTSANASKSNSLAKLSSGLRINKAGDDAAGLAISEKMKNQVSGMTQASRNAQDGISLIQTAEGALGETHSILNRMRDLTVQAGNETNTAEDKDAIQVELDSLSDEIDRISDTTDFNTQGLLDGKKVLVGAATGTAMSDTNFTDASAVTAMVTAYNKTVPTAKAVSDIDGLDAAVTSVKDRKQFIDVYNASVVNPGDKVTVETYSGKDKVEGTTFKFQIGANANENMDISIANMSSKALNIDTLDVNTGDTDANLRTLDRAISSVSTQRANLGAVQNRLDHTVSNLATTKENLSEANSRITDVDMAEEMMSFTKSNILSQASTSMLAQANQMPQSVLSLLQ